MSKEFASSIYQDVLDCEACNCFEAKYRFALNCHGQGGLGIMLVGLCPSRASVEAGRYFNQGSLRTLAEGILDIDEDCYLSDVIKCDTEYSTVQNNALDSLAQKCGDLFLHRELNCLRPNVIVAIGRVAFEYLTGIDGRFSFRQSDGIEYHTQHLNIPVYPIIHPSYGNIHYGRAPHQQQPYRENVRTLLTYIGDHYGEHRHRH
jgi:uracil-DNA glycosylase family 4